MNTFYKKTLSYLAVALISVGATFGTYKYLEKNSTDKTSIKSHSAAFNQDANFKLVSQTEEAYPDFTKAVDNTVNAVVHIKSIAKGSDPSGMNNPYNNPFFEFFFGPRGNEGYSQEPQPRIGSGSGVIISEDGYIITNNHVIDKATELEVTLNDNSKYNAKVIGTDPNTDIALIKITGDHKFPYVPFGDSDKLKVGEWVIAVGNPFNLTSTVTKGIVSAKARGNIGGGNRNSIQSFIQTDAAINPGNSGGALVNTRGELIGINTAIYSQTGSFAGYGFAVPISIAGKVAADIKEFGAVQRALLGVEIIDLNIAKEVGDKDMKSKTEKIKLNDGVYVGGFAEQSPAKQAGIEEGDVIVSVNGVKTPSSSILQEQVSRFRPGDKINVEVNRFGTKKNFEVVLKNSEGTTSIIKKEDGLALAGAAFKDLTDEQKKNLGISYGVEVAGVDKDGAFARKGINKGFIILEIENQPIRSVKDIERVISHIGNTNDKVLFIKGITPTGQKRFEAVELNNK